MPPFLTLGGYDRMALAALVLILISDSNLIFFFPWFLFMGDLPPFLGWSFLNFSHQKANILLLFTYVLFIFLVL